MTLSVEYYSNLIAIIILYYRNQAINNSDILKFNSMEQEITHYSRGKLQHIHFKYIFVYAVLLSVLFTWLCQIFRPWNTKNLRISLLVSKSMSATTTF
jgi:hypothetical protein